MSFKIRNCCLIGLSTAVMCGAAANAAQTERTPGDREMLTAQSYTEERYEWLSNKVDSTQTITDAVRRSDDKYPSMSVLTNELAAVTEGASALEGDARYINVETVPASGNTPAHKKVLLEPRSLVYTPAAVNLADENNLATAGSVQEKVTDFGVVGTRGIRRKVEVEQATETGAVQIGWRADEADKGHWETLDGNGYMAILPDEKDANLHHVEIKNERIAFNADQLHYGDAEQLVTAGAVRDSLGVMVIPEMPSKCKDAVQHCALVTSYDEDSGTIVAKWHLTAQGSFLQ